jgi:hypothetical protein
LLATLKQRDFALLWFGGLISMMGDWAMFAALPFYAYEQTNSAFASVCRRHYGLRPDPRNDC